MLPQPLKIVEAEVIPFRLPFRAEYVTARGRLEAREMALLRVRDADGFEGLGEAVPLALRGGTALGNVVDELESLCSALLGGASPAWRDGPAAGAIGHLSSPSRCAALTALADLEGRRRRMPLWQLLGAERPAPVLCNATLVSGSPQAVATDAIRWSEQGFTTFKLKVGLRADGRVEGLKDPDLAQIAAVREAVGEAARLRLDANGAWSVDRAEALLSAAGDLGIELIEQPVSSVAEMAELRRRLRARGSKWAVPIAADESVSSPQEAEAARRAAACDLATVKLSKTGQLRADLAGALPFYLSSALDGPVGIAAAAHAYQATDDRARAVLPQSAGRRTAPRSLAQGLATQRLFAETVARRECRLQGSELHLPPGPGLGVEIDEESLQAHRI